MKLCHYLLLALLLGLVPGDASAANTADPRRAEQWALDAVRAPAAWEIAGGGPVLVALIDTGISPDHPDLAGRLLPGFDVVNIDQDSSDDNGHGTFAAGVIAANTNNGIGVAGLCAMCQIVPVKALGADNIGGDRAIAAAIRYATDRGARVISLSLGGPTPSQEMADAVAEALRRNIVVVAAVGNLHDGRGERLYPAAYPGTIGVGATTRDDRRADFSPAGPDVDIVAPGNEVLSTYWSKAQGNGYGLLSGTSVATPFVAAGAALLLALRPELTPQQVQEILQLGADDLGPPGDDQGYGAGRLNLARALQLVRDPAVTSHSQIAGVVGGPAPERVAIELSTGQTTRPDASGAYRFADLPGGSYTVRFAGDGLLEERHAQLSGTARSQVELDIAGPGAGGPDAHGGDRAGAFAAAAPLATAVFFPQTQHNLGGELLGFWRANGGLPIFGYPISEAFAEVGEDGASYTVQYFERHRLELHPEQPPPYRVLLSRAGDLALRRAGRDWRSFAPSGPKDGCLFFAETGQRVCEPFLRYWRGHGLAMDGRGSRGTSPSLALFGLPLSPPVVETIGGRTLTVQWFERARFEDHGADGVLLGLLGDELR